MNWFQFATVRALQTREKTKQPLQSIPEESTYTEVEEETENEDQWVVCRQCGQRLARTSNRTAVNGAHRHTFANPSGIVFEIGCYLGVQGCGYAGQPSTEFAWFAGHSWRIAVCQACLIHLGWFFISGQGSSFHGLILDRISEVSIPKDNA
jgi:hypothetical protein